MGIMDSFSPCDETAGCLWSLDALMDPKKAAIGRSNQEKRDYRIEQEKRRLSSKMLVLGICQVNA